MCLHSHQQRMGVPVGWYQHLVLSVFMFSHFGGCLVVSHCWFMYISLMTSDVEHHFMCLVATHISSVQICCPLFKLSCLIIEYRNSLYILYIKSFVDTHTHTHIHAHTICFLLIFSFSLIKINLSYFCFTFHALDVLFLNLYLPQDHEDFLLCFL